MVVTARIRTNKTNATAKYPAEFETWIKKALPKLIKFTNISLTSVPKETIASIDKETLNNVTDTFRKTVVSEFYLTSIARSDIWEIVYDSTSLPQGSSSSRFLSRCSMACLWQSPFDYGTERRRAHLTRKVPPCPFLTTRGSRHHQRRMGIVVAAQARHPGFG
jgi:hypothetical protein